MNREAKKLFNNVTLRMAFNGMLLGKKYRMTKEARAHLLADKTITDLSVWWTIDAINCDGTINIVGNNHCTFNCIDHKVLNYK